MHEEVQWPDAERRRELGRRISAFPGCTGFIDGTLVIIRRPHDNKVDLQRLYFNGRKKIHCMNNTVVVDHDGLFIFVDSGYPGAVHDVTMLHQSILHQRWREALSSTFLEIVRVFATADTAFPYHLLTRMMQQLDTSAQKCI